VIHRREIPIQDNGIGRWRATSAWRKARDLAFRFSKWESLGSKRFARAARFARILSDLIPPQDFFPMAGRVLSKCLGPAQAKHAVLLRRSSFRESEDLTEDARA
jgi:hypothetical protein